MILNKKILCVIFLFAAAPALARPRVVASFSLLGDWARVVAGPDADVSVLVGPGGDAHLYEPTPAAARELSRADVLLEVGESFEPWLERLLSAAGEPPAGRVRVRATDGVVLRRVDGQSDPHVWGNPLNASRAVEGIRAALSSQDPGHAAAYAARAAAYQSELRALDAWIRARTAVLPPERRLLVTSHDTLGYWADRYGFRVIDTILSSFSTEAADPSAARVARLADEIRRLGAPAIFVEIGAADGVARSLAGASGARLAPALYTDALGPAGTPGDTYIGMMRYNAQVIVEALK